MHSQTVYMQRAHTHSGLSEEWLWAPKWSSLGYIEVLGGGSPRPDPNINKVG